MTNDISEKIKSKFLLTSDRSSEKKSITLYIVLSIIFFLDTILLWVFIFSLDEIYNLMIILQKIG